MKIMYFRGKYPNFGDELNNWMWQKLLPDFFDDDESELFIGIGSTIGINYDKSAKKIIFGTGFVANYNEKPDVSTSDWNIYFVRGPRTATALNIAPDLALGDAAILLRTVVDFKNRKPEVVSFIPHWESLERGNWQEVCDIAGINLIDSRRPVEEVIAELLRSKLVICEAMHGAIVADAFRIPWIPVIPLVKIHRDKWYDWAEALDIELNPHRLLHSTVISPKTYLDGSYRNIIQKTKDIIKEILSKKICSKIIIYIAAQRLRKISRQKPCLSSDSKISDITEKMLEKLQQFHRDYRK